MLVGIDFDNTIVCYDRLFHRIAVEQQLIPDAVPSTKEEVRNYLRRCGREKAWTELQGYVYGQRISEADIFPGLLEFLLACRNRKIDVQVISHKTRYPFEGPQYDLHQAARGWLEQMGFFDPDRVGLPAKCVHFEPTKQRKLARIDEAGCQIFIDDLPEFLLEPGFPSHVNRILFDPARSHIGLNGLHSVGSWAEIAEIILREQAS